MFTLDNFDSTIDAIIVQRGQAYFADGAVESLEEDPPGTWAASVEGSEDYEVEVILSGRKVTDHYCDCPYEGGPVCKHVVAVLYALREQSDKPAAKPRKASPLSFEGLLLKTDLEELRQFIRHEKQQDHRFKERFMLFFAQKDPNLDIGGKYEDRLRQLIRDNSKRGFMEYRQTFEFSKDVSPILQAAETALAQQNYHDAMAIGQVICRETMQLIPNTDDSAGNISSVLWSGISILQKIAEAPTVSPELLERLFHYTEEALPNKYWFEYGDFGYDLLKVAEKAALRTEPDAYLRLLDTLAAVCIDQYSYSQQEHFKVSRIRFYEATGRSKEAEKLIAANLDILEVRRDEVQKAVQKKAFARAKQLVAEGIQIAEAKRHHGTVSQWEETLLAIARAENDVATERHLTRKLTFDRGVNIKYYQQWKATYSAAEWPAIIEAHIQSVIATETSRPRGMTRGDLEYSLYIRLAPIFIQEEQWERLVEVAANYCSESTLATVHPYLVKRYPEKMLAMYLRVIESLGDAASNRKEYQHIAALMKKAKHDIPGSRSTIENLAIQLMRKYPRRPAMLEEMHQIIKG